MLVSRISVAACVQQYVVEAVALNSAPPTPVYSPSVAYNTDSNVPALTLIDNNGEGRQSSLFWEDGSYLKLRNLSIGYTPDEQWLNQYGISSARIYLQGSNLLTITPSGTLSQDPETPNGNFPIPKRITLGVNLSF